MNIDIGDAAGVLSRIPHCGKDAGGGGSQSPRAHGARAAPIRKNETEEEQENVDSRTQNAHPILVDDRERAGGLAAALGRLLGGRVECARLAVGDVRIGERLVIERKEAADFVASLLDGRLARQAHALGQAAGRAVIIIEGEFTPEKLAGMAGGEVREAMLSLILDRGLAVLRSRDVEDTARWIAALARREEGGRKLFAPTLRPAESNQPHPAAHRARRKKKSAEFPNPQSNAAPLAALRQVGGLGPARARALLERFGTMPRLLAASEAELAEVPGIGPALARAIRERFLP